MWCFRSQQALVLLETVDGAFTPLLGVLPSLALKQEQQSCLPEANWPVNPPVAPLPKAQLPPMGAYPYEDRAVFARTWLPLLSEGQQWLQAMPPLAGILAEHTAKQDQGGACLGPGIHWHQLTKGGTRECPR